MSLRRTQFKLAEKNPTMAIFLGKQYLGQRDNIEVEHNAQNGILGDLIGALNKAKENINTIMPGYTHMQKAQPITFAHHIMAYAEMLKRDYGRLLDCYERMNEMPLGSGALATSTYPIDRNFVSNELGFNKPTK